MNIRSWLNNLKSNFLYKNAPGIIDWLLAQQVKPAEKKINKAWSKNILIDNSVLGYGVTHETGWVSTGKELWGDKIEIDTGYAARIPVYSDDDASKVGVSVRYLAPIAMLAKRKAINLLSSRELSDEQWTQPVGRFRGYEFYDYNVFKA